MIIPCKQYLIKTAVKTGILSRWTFKRYCSDEAKQLGYKRSKSLFSEKRKFHKNILMERDPKKRALLAIQHYDKIYVEINKILPSHNGDKKASYGFMPSFIENRTDLFKDKIVIDIGCGPGMSTELISRYAKYVYGLEYSRIILEDAINDYGQIANIKFSPIEDIRLPFEDESIDLAYSNDVIEHLHPDDAFMHFQEVKRVLKNDGKYYFWTPGRTTGPHDFTRNFYLGGYGVRPKASHIKEYCFAELIDILKKVGFRRANIPDVKKEVLMIAVK